MKMTTENRSVRTINCHSVSLLNKNSTQTYPGSNQREGGDWPSQPGHDQP